MNLMINLFGLGILVIGAIASRNRTEINVSDAYAMVIGASMMMVGVAL